MKIKSIQIIVGSIALFTLPELNAAVINYDPGESVGGPQSANFTGYGSAGYLLDSVALVSSSPSGGYFTGIDPLNFSGGGFATSNQLPSSIVAANLAGTDANAGGNAYGTVPNGDFDFIGLGGSVLTTADPSASVNEFEITFNLASTSGYRIAIMTQSSANNNGVNLITLSSGASSSANSNVLSGELVFYSFDVTNISAGDTVTVNLSQAQDKDLFTYGFTLDALPPSSVPEPSTMAALLIGGAGLLAFRRRNRRLSA
jgi:hypothetical protein